MKAIPLDLDLSAIEALKKADNEAETAEAKAKLDALLAKHVPPGGWPVKTVENVNKSAATEATERHTAKWEEVFKPGTAALIRSGARRQGLGTPKESK